MPKKETVKTPMKKVETKQKKQPVKKAEPPQKKQPVKATKKAPVKKPEAKTPEKEKMPEITTFPTVRKGDKNAYVTVLQANLQARGYDIGTNEITGVFDDALLKAVKEFQKDNGGKSPNGVVGPKTWKLLKESEVRKVEPEPEPVPEVAQKPTMYRVLIEGLTKFQAEVLSKIFCSNMECRILQITRD